MNIVLAFASGLVFGLGLIVAGMIDPAKVLGFLDFAGAWDPSLALVMAGAIPVSAVAFLLARKRGTSLLGEPLRLPTTRGIHARLVAGSVVFGIGWGLAGLCPAPGVLLLGTGRFEGALFVAALAAGMTAHALIERARAGRDPQSVPQP